MDVFEKRDALLDLQASMLNGDSEKDDRFLSLINFENWCSNSGLSGFAQDFQINEIQYIEVFAGENNFILVPKMIALLKGFFEQYGEDFIDCLSEEEFEDLSQYDDGFFEIQDDYTSVLYDKFVRL